MPPLHLHIRHVRVEPNVILAPMEGVTDLTFRRLIRQIGGAGLTCTEFIPSVSLKSGEGRAWETAQFDPDERPVSVQLYGRKPDVLAEAARVVQDMGATICDINMGCPSKSVCNNSGGSSLLRDPALVQQIVASVRRVLSIPLTVKMRSGFDARSRNAPEIARICQEEGAEAVTVHWRTREDRYGGTRAVDKIAEVKARLSIPVIGNGDIIDVPSALAMFQETGCDGVMVGRGAMRNPWVLLQIAQALRGEPVTEVTPEERRRVLLGYLEDIRARFGADRPALGRFKKLANYFALSMPGGEALRTALLHSHSVQEAVERAERWFDELRERGGAHELHTESSPKIDVTPVLQA